MYATRMFTCGKYTDYYTLVVCVCVFSHSVSRKKNCSILSLFCSHNDNARAVHRRMMWNRCTVIGGDIQSFKRLRMAVVSETTKKKRQSLFLSSSPWNKHERIYASSIEPIYFERIFVRTFSRVRGDSSSSGRVLPTTTRVKAVKIV